MVALRDDDSRRQDDGVTNSEGFCNLFSKCDARKNSALHARGNVPPLSSPMVSSSAMASSL
jgi:hypothetical protein